MIYLYQNDVPNWWEFYFQEYAKFHENIPLQKCQNLQYKISELLYLIFDVLYKLHNIYISYLFCKNQWASTWVIGTYHIVQQ